MREQSNIPQIEEQIIQHPTHTSHVLTNVIP